MQNRISRRSAFLLAAAPAVARSSAQTASSAETPEQMLEAQRQAIQSNSRALAGFELKRAEEPAFIFRA